MVTFYSTRRNGKHIQSYFFLNRNFLKNTRITEYREKNMENYLMNVNSTANHKKKGFFGSQKRSLVAIFTLGSTIP